MIRSPSLAREFSKAAAVPWNSACTLGGILSPRCTCLTALIAPPSAALGARLNDTVTEGNCPWRLMERGDWVRSKRVNAPSGTAFAELELPVTFEMLAPLAPTPALMALVGGMRTP